MFPCKASFLGYSPFTETSLWQSNIHHFVDMSDSYIEYYSHNMFPFSKLPFRSGCFIFVLTRCFHMFFPIVCLSTWRSPETTGYLQSSSISINGICSIVSHPALGDHHFLGPPSWPTGPRHRGDCRGSTHVVKTTSTAGAAVPKFWEGFASGASWENGKCPLIVLKIWGNHHQM